ncbi:MULTISPECIES: ABC transporter ATP-binding protein [unclassified Paraflavitalea]|uniref:ABC transporter ATP-binding protein n=1 Tax=unclassified Paraflavitalea TaxID=2798305 RepID=UPI003D3487DE
MSSISIREINKSYGKGTIAALKNINLDVAAGELFGLIGPDGAGKTTLFRILTTLLLPDSGYATVGGYDVLKDIKQIRSSVGYMPGKFSLYQDLSVEENLRFFATVFGTTIQENYNLIKDIYVQLEPFKNRRAGKLSGGMKQKLALCCALIHKPTVLFLDEPTTGVDAVSRKEFWGMLKNLKREGITIFVSTPYMDEANLCERIALIQGGSILSVDTPVNITRSYGEALYAVRSENMPLLQSDLRTMSEIKTCYSFGSFHHVTLQVNGSSKVFELLNSTHPSFEWKEIEPTIEDCFIKLMQHEK